MVKLRLIEKEDIPGLVYHDVDWDVVIKGRAYQVIDVPGFVHTIGGRLDHGSGNSYWAYPLGEEIRADNLIEFDGHPGARFGIEYYPTNYIRNKWDETSVEGGRHLIITRNEKPFYDGFMTIHEAMALVLDGKIDEHPLNLNMRDFDKKCIGRKVWYRSQPGIITQYIDGQACVIIEPDGIEAFTRPAEWDKDILTECDSIKDEIFSRWIYWFREE